MASHKLVWTALPNGVEDGKLKLSVLVSPRLSANQNEGDELRLWPQWVDWSNYIKGASFKVAFDGGPTVDASFKADVLKAELWRALFNQTSFVRPHFFDNYLDRTIVSYPARRVQRSIKQLYQEAGTQAPEGLPANEPLTWDVEYIDFGTGNSPTAAVHAVAGGGRFIYATHHETDLTPPLDPNLPPGRLFKIDRDTLEIVGQVTVGPGPRSMAVMPDRNDPSKNRIYVVNGGGALGAGASLMIVKETATGFAQPLKVDIGLGLFQVGASFARNQVFVTNGYGGRMFILDADTGAKQGEFTPDQPDESGQDINDVFVDAQDALYLTLEDSGGVPAPEGTPKATRVVKLVPQGPTGYVRAWRTTIRRMFSSPPMLAVDSQRQRVYITHGRPSPTANAGVTILDSSSGALISEVDVAGQNSLNLAASERFGYVYDLRGGEVTILNSSGRSVGRIPHNVGMNFGDIAVLPDTQQVVVGGDHTGKLMIATPSSTEAPQTLDDLLPGWEVPWTPEAEKAARDKLGSNALEDRDLTARVLLFHRRPEEHPLELPQSEQDFRTLLDFHEALSSLSDYPELMRRLGLVIDLTIPVAGVPTGQRVVRVLPTLPQAQGPAVENKSMGTTVRFDGTRFEAVSQGDEIVDGLLALDGERYELQQLDVDGATLKLVNTAATLTRVAPGDTLRKALPALRSAGIALVRDEHAAALRTRFSRSLAHDNALAEGEDSVLFAEDLVRGYRIDVRDGGKTWRSLCRRVGSYSFGANGQTQALTISDEGIVETGVTEAAEAKRGSPNDLYLDEAVARWNGYSLVAGRPGNSSGEDGQPLPDDNIPATPFKLRVDFVPEPKSLPRLRYGEEYEMRARVVDLAGNSVSLENAPDVGLPKRADRFAYLRYEPVPAPAVVLRAPITEQTTPGEALERLVLRTANSRIEQDGAISSATAERHIAAPRTAQSQVETHGVLDRNGALQANVYDMLAQRDAGQFPVHAPTDMPVDGAAQLALPYLADPLSQGATLRDLPGAPAGSAGSVERGALVYRQLADGIARGGSATQIGWEAAWPEGRPFRVVVRDGAGTPEWNAQTRVLTVKLPKAAIARVPLSSFMREQDLKLMAVWGWLREHADERTRALFEKVDIRDPDAFDKLARLLGESAHYARYGGHAMLTPSRELVLVHAVQQPLGRPVWNELDPQRSSGQTSARLAGALQINAASSGSVELRARWDEMVDDRSQGPPTVSSNSAVLVDIPIPLPVVPHNPNQPFTTIKAAGRRVARFYAAQDRLELVAGAQPEHAFGDTRHRVVRYRAAASSRFREYFAPDAPGGFERESDEVVVRVPSSARPSAPRLRYAVPTFGWERAAAANIVSSRRRGHGLRVFLDRPWYSSGAGELLGVVILPRSLSDDERKKLKGLISQAGADPVFVSNGRAALNRQSFGAQGITWGNSLRLPGLNERVDVAGHAVHYDAERDLYFCDIAFDPSLGRDVEAYGAFVRLALVRFQPDSLGDVELSRAVTTEFLQVAPDRSAVVSYDPFDPGLVQLVVAGQTYRATLDELNQTRPDGTFVRVSVEERRPDVANELGWRPAQAKDVTIDAQQTSSIDTLLWRGAIRLPADRRPGSFRLVIKEFEPWLDDGALQSAGSVQLAPRAHRLVYAETIEV